MDIDVMAKHMPGLLKFKERIEAMLDGAEAGSGSAGEALNSRIDDLGRRIDGVVSWMEGAAPQIAALQKSEDDLTPILDGLAGLKDMADWFAANRAGLDVLLSIGDDMKADPAAAKEQAPAGAGLTLDQINATTKPQTPDVSVPDVLKDPAPAADAAAPQTDPAPEA